MSAGPDERGVWVPVEQMPKPPPSFAPHSSATPGRSTPTALVGDVVTRVAESGERVQYVTPKRHPSEPAEAGDPNPNPNSHPRVPEPDVATGAALYADFSRERDHPNLPYSRLPVFERLYRRIPEGQRRKFAFSPGANGGDATTGPAEKSPAADAPITRCPRNWSRSAGRSSRFARSSRRGKCPRRRGTPRDERRAPSWRLRAGEPRTVFPRTIIIATTPRWKKPSTKVPSRMTSERV